MFKQMSACFLGKISILCSWLPELVFERKLVLLLLFQLLQLLLRLVIGEFQELVPKENVLMVLVLLTGDLATKLSKLASHYTFSLLSPFLFVSEL
jgi:hypothetical protein